MTTRRMSTKKFYGRRGKGRRRPVAGEMNSLERKFAGELEALRGAGLIWAWWWEPLKLRLAKATYYTPDFLVQHADDRLELVETKGRGEEDARVKWKLAGELVPWADLTAVVETRGRRTIEKYRPDAVSVAELGAGWKP